jgi:hypothetical protein
MACLPAPNGQYRLISLGDHHGGPAGYGLRRQLVDEDSLRRRCCVGRTRAYGLRLLGLFYLIFGLAFEKR